MVAELVCQHSNDGCLHCYDDQSLYDTQLAIYVTSYETESDDLQHINDTQIN